MASSSALKLADLALVWDEVAGCADIVLIDSDIASDPELATAMLLSLFTDRRAEVDDKPPSGDPSDRRGWWADEFAVVEGDKFGSRMWLLDRSKLTNNVTRDAELYAREATAWLLEDRVAQSVDVAVEMTSNALLMRLTANRPGRDPVSFKFAHVWDSQT